MSRCGKRIPDAHRVVETYEQTRVVIQTLASIKSSREERTDPFCQRTALFNQRAGFRFDFFAAEGVGGCYVEGEEGDVQHSLSQPLLAGVGW